MEETDKPERFGGKRLLRINESRGIEPLPAPNAPEVDFERLFDALKLTSDERKALEASLESSLPEAAERLKWTGVKLRNTLDRARRRIAKGNLAGREAEYVKISASSRRSLNPAYPSRSESGALTWNLAPLSESNFAAIMRDELSQVSQKKASA